MTSQSKVDDNVSTEDSIDEDSSDDDLLYMDAFGTNFGDLMMLNCFVANKVLLMILEHSSTQSQEGRTTFQCHEEILDIQTCLDFLSLIEVKDIICMTMLDSKDCVGRKNCSTIDTPCAVTLLNVALEF
ncbi:uncharacterized protein LOC111401518 [Olea europaea var. sylvestris]|uniref:uncharacterized protein LOC111401518 n=1 Tax=Olea europaea var. sylvestris TaxID=158386 RepID=UPI000C1D3DE9|nr:uncharacterized protein LOC111401518 [Olea europaea var. sylvestris]